MHELSIAQNVLRIALEQASRHCGEMNDEQRITAIGLRIGVLAQVVPDALQFSFAVIARGTIAEGASLEIETCPVRLSCKACGEVTESEEPIFLCGACGSYRVELLSGRELMVTSLTVGSSAKAPRP